MASITDAIKKAAANTDSSEAAPTVTVADTSNLTANSSSGK